MRTGGRRAAGLPERIAELANLVMSEGRPGVQGATPVDAAEGAVDFAAAAAPLPGEVAPLGALVVVNDELDRAVGEVATLIAERRAVAEE